MAADTAIVTIEGVYTLYIPIYYQPFPSNSSRKFNKKDGYRQQNVRQPQKIN